MPENLPYVTSVGTLKKMLEKIKTAATPERFTQDFVSTKLHMKGGTPRAIIPFIKKMGLVGDNGVPSSLYKEFRNHNKSGAAIAKSMRILYQRLFEMNEYVYDASDEDVLGLIVEATGGERDSQVTKFTLATFRVVRALADFEAKETDEGEVTPESPAAPTVVTLPVQQGPLPPAGQQEGINLSYTINLNLPPTADIEVFHAIFKSLKEHLLPK